MAAPLFLPPVAIFSPPVSQILKPRNRNDDVEAAVDRVCAGSSLPASQLEES